MKQTKEESQHTTATIRNWRFSGFNQTFVLVDSLVLADAAVSTGRNRQLLVAANRYLQ